METCRCYLLATEFTLRYDRILSAANLFFNGLQEHTLNIESVPVYRVTENACL